MFIWNRFSRLQFCKEKLTVFRNRVHDYLRIISIRKIRAACNWSIHYIAFNFSLVSERVFLASGTFTFFRKRLRHLNRSLAWNKRCKFCTNPFNVWSFSFFFLNLIPIYSIFQFSDFWFFFLERIFHFIFIHLICFLILTEILICN